MKLASDWLKTFEGISDPYPEGMFDGGIIGYYLGVKEIRAIQEDAIKNPNLQCDHIRHPNYFYCSRCGMKLIDVDRILNDKRKN